MNWQALIASHGPQALWAAGGFCVGALVVGLWLRARLLQTGERLAAVAGERDQQRQTLDATEQQRQRLQNEVAVLTTRLDAERRQAEEKLALLGEARESLTHQFKTLSQEILEEKSRRFTEQNRQGLEAVLKPLGERIAGFEKQVRETYHEENRQRAQLGEQLRHLRDLNQQVAEDAVNLTNALRGESRIQGNWGEMVLETVLERSGLLNGPHYETQFSRTDEGGDRKRPDAVIYLPDNRAIVVDSKVSLSAYLRVHEAADEDQRAAALREHLDSVRRHLRGLSRKAYQDIPNEATLDYVFMFVPSEAAYVEALRGDFSLQREALDANVAIVSPTTLMPMLRAVANLWRLQSQEENAAEIARRAGQMYDKLVGFVADMDKLKRGLDSAVGAYDDARNKLVDGRGNLIGRAEKLRELGASAGKRLDADWRRAGALGDGVDADDSPDADEGA